MDTITNAFSSIKALRNVAADQLDTDPARACMMSLQACEQMLEFCAVNEVDIPTGSQTVRSALQRFMAISQAGDMSRRVQSQEIDASELEAMALDLLGAMDVLFEAVQRKLTSV